MARNNKSEWKTKQKTFQRHYKCIRPEFVVMMNNKNWKWLVSVCVCVCLMSLLFLRWCEMGAARDEPTNGKNVKLKFCIIIRTNWSNCAFILCVIVVIHVWIYLFLTHTKWARIEFYVRFVKRKTKTTTTITQHETTKIARKYSKWVWKLVNVGL